jgi:serine protease Do
MTDTARSLRTGLVATAIFGLACLESLAANLASYPWDTHLHSDRPHPAVARIIVPEGDVTSFGSGTLVDVRDQFGLVITNWHVVRDNKGEVEVVFPDGFRSKARPLKVDEDWDLAALVIWRPPVPPVAMADRAPQSGDQLTICGYGQGQYRSATGRCTQYYAPKVDLPQHMVELDVEARQGDSGGPIFNDRGELAGVLFGAGGGTTLGSFGGRVESFLATLAPDIGRAADSALMASEAAPIGQSPLSASEQLAGAPLSQPAATLTPVAADGGLASLAPSGPSGPRARAEEPAALWAPADGAAVDGAGWQAHADHAEPQLAPDSQSALWLENARNVLAAIGAIAIVAQILRIVG